MDAALDFAAIRATLPHGHPMVLLDRVEQLLPGRSVRAVKAVSGCEPCYAGLDRSAPAAAYAYPQPLVVESFGQAAAILWLHSRTGPPGTGVDEVLMLAAVRDCRFDGRAYPGDVLRHEACLEHRGAGAASVSGATWVGDRRIASFGSLLAVVRPASAVPVPTAGGLPC